MKPRPTSEFRFNRVQPKQQPPRHPHERRWHHGPGNEGDRSGLLRHAEQQLPAGIERRHGPGLLINANLIQGNSADSGNVSGIRLQQVNGTETGTFASQPHEWQQVAVSNNIVANNPEV